MTRTEYNSHPNQCKHCGKSIMCKEGERPSNVKKKQFCNSSCASSYNNQHRQRKLTTYYCSVCNTPIGAGAKFARTKYCDTCRPGSIDWDVITYGEAKAKRSYQYNSRIRTLAREKYLKSDKPKYCVHCGYTKHFEVCHIKGISEHDDFDTVGAINNLDNLIALCPNCHWELDNGLLSSNEI